MADQPKILVIDDNAENRALAQSTLEDEDCSVVLAAGGAEGLRLFEAERPDCVLLDVRMPGMDGFEVCARLRELPDGADVPIVFLTAQRDVDTFDRALRAGGDDFLTKPVRPTELVIRVQAALKLRRMSAELREHYALVRSQRDDLMRLQLQKERLTAFVVHDLKNPVNSMDLHAQLLLRNKDLPERARESVQRIREEARSLLRLVLNLLDISKSEEGQLTPKREPIDLDALLQQVQEEHEVKASGAEVSLKRVVEVPSVAGDEDLLRRVIDNLVENAIRHAPRGSEVVLRTVSHPGAIEIQIVDAGPGVSPEMRERIFERFVQLDFGERVVSRTNRGLGLAFCKLAVE
ncbi:MAG TPA: hybrid sensor histidine kinase/response regulator, partial [Polyangiales bacterium]|nr:hybrid sensor histidine kinase/response regulator [Polyangiales bacterium]